MYDPTRLAALVAVAEAGSITRAAARLGYTAPALSQQIAKLERESGAALLVRHHRGPASRPRASCCWDAPGGSLTRWTWPAMSWPGSPGSPAGA